MNLCNALNELWIYLNILIQVFTIDLSVGMFHYIFVYETGVHPSRSNQCFIRVLRVLLHQYILIIFVVWFVVIYLSAKETHNFEMPDNYSSRINFIV